MRNATAAMDVRENGNVAKTPLVERITAYGARSTRFSDALSETFSSSGNGDGRDAVQMTADIL
jgi:hypothetical protein